MSTSSLYESVLAVVGANPALAATRPPRASASVVLWRRREGAGLEVYWVRRSEALAFMGGWHAFPGGALAKSDAAARLLGEPRAQEPGPAAMPESLSEGYQPPESLLPGLAACALRELLEETGVLPVAGSVAGLAGRLAAAREALLEGDASLGEALSAQGLEADASRLVLAGRWLTPPLGPVRFDNRFFLLEWPAEAPIQPQVIPGELASGEWVEPGAAYRRWQRGEVITAPPILHLLKVLAQDGPEAGLPRLLDPAEANLGPYRRIEFRPHVVQLPLKTFTLPPATHTNAYFVGRDELVLVDPGSADPAEVARLEQAVAALAREGRRVSAIWLTHHHPDHIGGVPLLVERLGLPVAAHAETAARLGRQGIAVTRLLEDGQVVELAGDPPYRLRVLHTPGHARGHLCFLAEETGSLLTGDMISTVSTIVVDPPEGDMDDYLASLSKLLEVGAQTAFPSHGPPAARARQKLQEFIDHRLWREEKLLEAWATGARSHAELRAAAYEDTPPIAYPLAERQIEAHLQRLRRAGRIS